MKKKTILSSLLTIILCLSLIAGSTYALFTSEDQVNIAVNSATVKLDASITNVQTWSLEDDKAAAGRTDGTFSNGGSAKVAEDGSFSIALLTPGDKVSFDIVGENTSNVLTQYRYIIECVGETKLMEVLDVTINGTLYKELLSYTSAWANLAALTAMPTVKVTIEMPVDVNDDYQNLSTSIDVTVEAVQGNAGKTDAEKVKFLPDKWDGTADTSWFTEADANATEFTLTTSEAIAGLATLVEKGNTFEGKTIKLESDLDLAGIAFNPIGHSANGQAFKGVFDGQGHTISNLYQQSDLGAWQYEGEYYGLFAYTNGATIKNVTVADAYISSGRNEAAGVVGHAVNTTFSDITISNVTLIAYNNSAGGVAAECYGDCSFNNITVDAETVIGPLWGTYDVRLGGVVGMVQAGNNVTFSNITVACQLDAINDVAANYQYWLYRYSGMLIGHVDGVNGVADPTGYVTCENVKVIYGDWVNYHYCEFESLGAGSYNGPGEYKYARVEAGTGTDGIDISACNHDEDESHNVLIVFDQLFGGGQGVSGLKTYDGVEVIYPEN